MSNLKALLIGLGIAAVIIFSGLIEPRG